MKRHWNQLRAIAHNTSVKTFGSCWYKARTSVATK
jgi:hypothetical protein